MDDNVHLLRKIMILQSKTPKLKIEPVQQKVCSSTINREKARKQIAKDNWVRVDLKNNVTYIYFLMRGLNC